MLKLYVFWRPNTIIYLRIEQKWIYLIVVKDIHFNRFQFVTRYIMSKLTRQLGHIVQSKNQNKYRKERK